jgi:virulence-associated protein VagC
MAATAKLFKLGKAQAVRIPARFRLEAAEVEITSRDGALILRPKPRSALDVLNAARAHLGEARLVRPRQGKARALPSFE